MVSAFNGLQSHAEDPIAGLMVRARNDPSPDKIDISVGVYKSEEGDPNYVFPSVKLAKARLAENDPGHCYTQMDGIPEFLAQAQKTVFGEVPAAVTSVQGVSGAGSLHVAFVFLREMGYRDFYVGTPCWANYKSMIEHVGGVFNAYNYLDAATLSVDFAAVEAALNAAPENSVFVLQAVCHNPTGVDLSHDQWRAVFALLQKRNLFPLFDIAYQGFASGNLDEDAWAIREARRQGLEFIVCQSFSKNMGLYSERVGAVHVAAQDEASLPAIKSRLVTVIRKEVSFCPAFGARVSALIQGDPDLRKVWLQDVLDVTHRIHGVRRKVHDKLTELGTPGDWSSVIKSNGLFWYSGLTEAQVERLVDEFHIYGTANGRVNVAGLNDSNIDYYCRSIDRVVRG